MKNYVIILALMLAVVGVFALRWQKANHVQAPSYSAVVAPPVGEADARHSLPAAGETILPPGFAAGVPRLVSLGAGACIPCRKMEPVRQALRRDYPGQLLVDFIDVWDNPEAGRLYGIRLIPTLVVYDAEGLELGRVEGYVSKEELLPILEGWGVVLTQRDT